LVPSNAVRGALLGMLLGPDPAEVSSAGDNGTGRHVAATELLSSHAMTAHRARAAATASHGAARDASAMWPSRFVTTLLL
jgi:hypothetical protein